MKLSAWLQLLGAILGVAKAKPAHISDIDRATAIVETVETVIDTANSKQLPK